MEIKRRSFLTGIAAAAAVTILPENRAKAGGNNSPAYATLIDLTKCDGCEGKEMPLCVEACRTENEARFPKPDPAKIKDYWPQNKHEDWRDKRHIINRLTPYNWFFVQKLEVDGKKVAVPRRCMHCDNPPCVKLCPFGVNKKLPEGPVFIEEDLCFGGAKCRTVCPWSVPQRQAGVGIYTFLQPVPVGGGVLYKCDLCKDKLLKGKTPKCAKVCPQNAIEIGNKEEIIAKAKELEKKYNGHLYGLEEHGGTSTIYVSVVPFEKIDKAILAKAKKPKKAMRMHNPKNVIEKTSALATAAVIAPLAGAATAFIATAMKSEGKQKSKEEANDENR